MEEGGRPKRYQSVLFVCAFNSVRSPMAEALARQGYPAELVEVPDAHHFTAWRDAFDPHLTRLLARSWGETSWSLGSYGPGAWGPSGG